MAFVLFFPGWMVSLDSKVHLTCLRAWLVKNRYYTIRVTSITPPSTATATITIPQRNKQNSRFRWWLPWTPLWYYSLITGTHWKLSWELSIECGTSIKRVIIYGSHLDIPKISPSKDGHRWSRWSSRKWRPINRIFITGRRNWNSIGNNQRCSCQ